MKHIALFLTCLAFIMGACSSRSTADEELRKAEMAIAAGDMQAASSIAQHLTDDRNLSGLSATQLGRLSIVYMQIADSVDNTNSVAAAADAYRRAFTVDADSADGFYSSLPTEQVQYYMMLSAIVANQDNPYDGTPFDEPTDTDTIPQP